MKYAIWDFDETLGYRQGSLWSGTLIEIAHRYDPERTIEIEEIRPYLISGYPWSHPERPHPEIKTAQQWWDAMDPVFEKAFESIGFNSLQGKSMAKQVRPVYTALEHWRLYEDTLPTLNRLLTLGWKHLVLSNHVPELRDIIHHLGLAPYLTHIFNSAETGYEKPNPQAFQNVLNILPDKESVWMIGDSPRADIAGAEALGIPALLVRKRHPDAKYQCDQLSDVIPILEADIRNI